MNVLVFERQRQYASFSHNSQKEAVCIVPLTLGQSRREGAPNNKAQTQKHFATVPLLTKNKKLAPVHNFSNLPLYTHITIRIQIFFYKYPRESKSWPRRRVF